MSSISSIAAAISRAEGFGVPNAIPTLANNPGNLKIGDVGFGTTGGGVTVFPDVASGQKALMNQLNKMSSGSSSVYTPDMSIAQIGNLWSGGDSNWSNNVAKFTGLTPSDTLFGNSSGTSSPHGGSLLSEAGGFLDGILGGLGINSTIGKTVTDPATAIENGWLVRGVSLAIGLICIGGGVMMFKSTSTIIEKAVSTGTKVAAIAA